MRPTTMKKELKSFLFDRVAHVAKATASPKRLELIDLLCQGERTVEVLADRSGMSIKLTSSHLQQLRESNLVESRREGRFIYYRVADKSVMHFWVALRTLAEERDAELQLALKDFLGDPKGAEPVNRKELIQRAKRGEVVVIDVRPTDEFDAGHLPYARSIPLAELEKTLASLPKGKEIIAYCRGPYCFLAVEAVRLLRSRGRRATHLKDGVAEWTSAGLPISGGSHEHTSN